jgi:hypothetical protein
MGIELKISEARSGIRSIYLDDRSRSFSDHSFLMTLSKGFIGVEIL